jgi:hypothetical protein
VTFFVLLEDFYPGRLAVKDRDKTQGSSAWSLSSILLIYCLKVLGLPRIVVLVREARCSSSSWSLDSSVRREVRLHQRVARRIDIPPSSGCVYCSHDWEIYLIHWIRRCIVKDRAKQSSSRCCQTEHRIVRILMKQREFGNKYKHYSTKVIFA